MLDTDFLLLPTLSHYFLSTPQGQGRASSFLSTQATLQNGTYAELLEKNVRRAVNLSRPFSESGACQDLPRIRDALVGNWRDSGIGLGNGKIPFDVSSELTRWSHCFGSEGLKRKPLDRRSRFDPWGTSIHRRPRSSRNHFLDLPKPKRRGFDLGDPDRSVFPSQRVDSDRGDEVGGVRTDVEFDAGSALR